MANERATGKGLKDISLKQMRKDAKKPILNIVGVFMGTAINRISVKYIEEKNKSGKIFNIPVDKFKRFVIPATELALGLAANQLIKNPNAKSIANGVVTNGGILLANQAFNTNVFSGINGLGTSEVASVEPTYLLPQEENVKLSPSLYELDEDPMGSVSTYIDSMMQNIEPEYQNPMSTNRVPDLEELDTEPEVEVNLQSEREEDNFEIERPVLETPEESVSGALEAIILEPEKPEIYTNTEYLEELDFSNIP